MAIQALWGAGSLTTTPWHLPSLHHLPPCASFPTTCSLATCPSAAYPSICLPTCLPNAFHLLLLLSSADLGTGGVPEPLLTASSFGFCSYSYSCSCPELQKSSVPGAQLNWRWHQRKHLLHVFAPCQAPLFQSSSLAGTWAGKEELACCCCCPYLLLPAQLLPTTGVA